MGFTRGHRELAIAIASAWVLALCTCSSFDGREPSPAGDGSAPGEVGSFEPDADEDGGVGADSSMEDAGPGCGTKVACMRTVFVTDATFTGALGDAEGADAKCQAEADLSDNPLVKGRRFIAWIAGSSSPANRVSAQGGGPYVRTDGTIVAANWQKFASAQHQTALDYNQYGFEAGVVSSHAWTGTTADGGSLSPHCSNWTTADSGTGKVGGINDTGGTWTDEEERPCFTEARLYCVEK